GIADGRDRGEAVERAAQDHRHEARVARRTGRGELRHVGPGEQRAARGEEGAAGHGMDAHRLHLVWNSADAIRSASASLRVGARARRIRVSGSSRGPSTEWARATTSVAPALVSAMRVAQSKRSTRASEAIQSASPSGYPSGD